MMKKILVCLLLAFIVFGCESPNKKSVLEDLTFSEISNLTKKDTLFSFTYNIASYVRDSVLNSEIERSPFYNLSYKRLHSLIVYSESLPEKHFTYKGSDPDRNEKLKAYYNRADSLFKNYDELSFRFIYHFSKNKRFENTF